jgi:hypothetical protein
MFKDGFRSATRGPSKGNLAAGTAAEREAPGSYSCLTDKTGFDRCTPTAFAHPMLPSVGLWPIPVLNASFLLIQVLYGRFFSICSTH